MMENKINTGGLQKNTSQKNSKKSNNKADGFWRSAITGVFKNKTAVVCLVIVFIVALISLIAPAISPYDYLVTDAINSNNAPNSEHLFGTDMLGRDLWVRVWKGTATSLLIGVFGAIFPQIIGVVIGSISGYVGGVIDAVIMSFVDMGVCVPSLVYITLISIWLPSSPWTIIFAISISSWMETARLVRGRTMQFKCRDFILAAKIQGASPVRIICKHIMPNIIGSVVVTAFSAIPTAIFTEAYLSFIGLGSSDSISLGQLCRTGISMYRLYPYQLFIPGVLISLIILLFYLIGNYVSDAFDVRLEK